MDPQSSPIRHRLSRRTLLENLATCAALGTLTKSYAQEREQPMRTIVRHGRLKQSMAYWCFQVAGEQWNIEQQAEIAIRLGCVGVELVEPVDFPTLLKKQLICALTPNGMPGDPFAKGLNNPRYHAEVLQRTRQAIDVTAAAGFPNVIAFTGYQWHDADDPASGTIPLEEGARNCVSGLKQLAAHAERQGVTVCIEMLNTRDETHPMKGHPGYQGNHLDYVAEIVKRVGSPRVKLLFDIYHVQVMDGDVIRRIRQYGDLIGHVHTAGNPGRCELDDDQEINYPACMKALLEVGYDGYVGHEFIPTRDPWEGLVQAVSRCDV